MADIGRPQSPTGMADIQADEMTQVNECIIRMIGIGNGGEVVVRAMAANAVLSDTGANSCMLASEENLEQCHDSVCGVGTEVGGDTDDARVLADGIHAARKGGWYNAHATIFGE